MGFLFIACEKVCDVRESEILSSNTHAKVDYRTSACIHVSHETNNVKICTWIMPALKKETQLDFFTILIFIKCH